MLPRCGYSGRWHLSGHRQTKVVRLQRIIHWRALLQRQGHGRYSADSVTKGGPLIIDADFGVIQMKNHSADRLEDLADNTGRWVPLLSFVPCICWCWNFFGAWCRSLMNQKDTIVLFLWVNTNNKLTLWSNYLSGACTFGEGHWGIRGA